MKKYILIMASFIVLFLWTAEPGAEGWIKRGMEIFKEHRVETDKDQPAEEEISLGLREALKVGSENVVSLLGRENGYYLDPRAHISLPKELQQVQHLLNRAGMGRMLDDLELRMNRAAEQATPRAREMFADAVSQLTLEDVMGIYNGPDDAATRYFQHKMTEPLSREFTPMVRQSLAEAGAVRVYEDIMSGYRQMPFVPDISADLTKHVVDRSIAAIFEYLALEEKAIRNNPAKQTTDTLRKIFGR